MININTKYQILKSTSIIGSSAIFVMFMAMIRIKFISITVGVIGIGLMANLNALLTAFSTISGMGIHQRSVREISIDYSSNNEILFQRRAYVLSALSFILGLLGLSLSLFFSENLSTWVFGDKSHKFDIQITSIAIVFVLLSNAFTSIIQGTRKISYLAYANIFGSLLGTLIALFCFVIYGLGGIVWALLSISIAQALSTGYFVRKIKLRTYILCRLDDFKIAWNLLRDGGPLMLSSLTTSVTTLIIMALITRELGMSLVGLYSAAFSLSVFFVGFVLTSMGSDYYPRLSSKINKKKEMNQIVNEQTEVGLHLTITGMLICYTTAPFLIEIFYSKEFLLASELLQWFVLGCFGRVISWPLGFIILALGKSKLFLLSELSINILHLSLVWLALNYFSIEETAIAFFITYIVYTIFMLFTSYQLIGFKWETKVVKLIILSLFKFLIIFYVILYLENWLGIFILAILIFHSLITSLKEISDIMGSKNKSLVKILNFPIIKNLISIKK